MSESWKTGGLDRDAVHALSDGLPASTLWSVLMHVMSRRARREARRILDQFKQDGFTAPAAGDQRVFVDVDRLLLESASAFEAIELSPVAPLGACSAVGLTTQNRVLSALRGCEVVSDPTNVMALECARRLQQDGRETVRLATVHRCLRAQPFPRRPGFAAHFRLFCLASGGRKGVDHEMLVAAMVEHIQVHLRALGQLQHCGYRFPGLAVTVLSTAQRSTLADRVRAAIGHPSAADELRHPYYDGLRFTITARTASGDDVPLADGGAFDWLVRLTSNRKLAFVASGLGTQLVVHSFRHDSLG